MNHQRSTRLLLLALALCLAWTPQLLAQDDGPTLLYVNRLHVKADMIDEFRGVHREVFGPAMKDRGIPWRVVSRTRLGDTMEFAVAHPIANFAELDQQRDWGDAEKMMEMAGEIWSRSVVSRQTFIAQHRPELSMEPGPRMPYSRRARIVVHFGQQGAFEALWKDEILPALAKSGVTGYQVYQTVAGGSSTEYWGLMPLANMAALDGFGVFRGLSAEEAAALNAKIAPLASTVEIAVTRYDEELSYEAE